MEDSRYSQKLQAGQTLFRMGEPGTCAYVIESGRIQISNQKNGAEQVIAVLQAGDIVGEMALIDDQPRSATAMAIEPSMLRVLTREYLSDRIHQSDPLLRHLLRRVIQRLRTSLFSQTFSQGGAANAELHAIDEDQRRAVGRLEAAQAIQQGLEKEQFELHLQPIVYLPHKTPTGFEALIRWTRPGVGNVPPMEFITFAEESDLIMDIGRWTFDTACSHLRHIDDSLPMHASSSLFVAVNLSGRQFSDPRLFDVIEDSIKKHKIAPNRLKLEVTETVLIHNFDVATKVLERCRKMGFQLALDDFGTGYSSLSYLNRFPVDTIKIDRAFVKEVVGNQSTQKIVRAVAGLGRDLGMIVLAEGIETEADATMLQSLGVEYGQGYLYGKAMSLEHTLSYLERAAPAA